MSVFDGLGVRTIINAKGTATRLSGGILRPEVAAAMAEASQSCVDMAELQAAASRVIADVTGAEAGYIASGASACLLLATAACIAGLDPGRMARLPDTRGLRNEVIMVRSQRNFYDHAIRAAGATIVEVGLPDRYSGAGVRDAESWEIEDAITDNTAAIHYVADAAAQPPLAEVVAIARRYKIPVFVDAAAQLPPQSNLKRFIAEGADLVAFSGGKVIGGPQASGMLAGIAVHILIGRLPIAFGLDLPPANPPDTLALLLHHAGEARLAPFLMASGIAAVCIAGSQIRKHFPAPLLALATAVAVAAVFDPGASIFPRTEALSGNAGLAWPSPDPANMAALLPVALSIAFLCLAQTAVVLRSGRHDSAETRRNAFGAVGIANIAVACIGGFGVNSSPPRTQLLRDSEAHSQLAGFGAALIGVLLVLFGAGLIRALPSAALAGVLIYIAYHLFTNAALEELIRRSPREGFLALATAALIIVMPLGIGLPVAILLSLLHASLPLFHAEVVELRNVPGTTIWWHQPASEHAKAGSSEPLVLGLTSPINFANAAGIVGRIRGTVAACPAPPTLLVLECAGVLAVDLSGADLLMELIRDLRARSIPVAIARLESDEAQQDMVRNGLLDCLGRENLFLSVSEAVSAHAER